MATVCVRYTCYFIENQLVSGYMDVVGAQSVDRYIYLQILVPMDACSFT